MSDSALDHLSKSGGFELGVGPSIVVLDAGTAKALTTTAAQNDSYAVGFDSATGLWRARWHRAHLAHDKTRGYFQAPRLHCEAKGFPRVICPRWFPEGGGRP